jgi:mannan endo-1,6-alpha-mannosidase
MADFPIQQGIRLQEFHLEWMSISSGRAIGAVYRECDLRQLGHDDVQLDANYSYAHTKPSNKELMTPDFSVHDGADVPDCTKIDYIQWTYNNGQFLAGSAFMYNYVPPIPSHLTKTNGDPYWKNNVDQLLANTFSKFFTNPANILFEPACEVTQTCNTDQTSFKGFLASYLAYVSQMAPYTAAQIYLYLATSAIAAGATCSGVGAGMTCSMQWTLGHYDGRERGVGEQLSLLNVVNSNLVKFTGAPVTHDSGGTSVGDPNAGSTGNPVIGSVTPATTGDKALAGVLTGSCAILLGLGGWLMIS